MFRSVVVRIPVTTAPVFVVLIFSFRGYELAMISHERLNVLGVLIPEVLGTHQ